MESLAAMTLASAAIPQIAHRAAQPGPPMDCLMVFGFFSAVLTITCYFEQRRSRAGLLVFGLSLAAMSLYGFLDGAWPLGITESVWSIATLRRWIEERRIVGPKAHPAPPKLIGDPEAWAPESRISRMFGPMSSDSN
jgi:hypothetical protein